jgi:DNA-binding NarL/FixJ family response regulator
MDTGQCQEAELTMSSTVRDAERQPGGGQPACAEGGSPAVQGADLEAVGCEALESALASVLTAVAELAHASGQRERALRLHGARATLRTGLSGASRMESPDLASPRSVESGAPLASVAGVAGVPGSASARLTVREQRVAGLIAEGLSNRQIADELLISERTADTHVQNIFNKLGVNCRSQVAVWYVGQGSARSVTPAGQNRS